MDCRTPVRIVGHRYRHGSQDMDSDMDRRAWIAGQGLQDMDMNWSYEHACCLQFKEFKSHIVYPV